LTHSPELHAAQAAGFAGTTLAKAGKKLDELAARLARGKTRRGRDTVAAEIETITAKPWVRRVITWQLDGDQPRDLRLTWSIDAGARAALEEELFGKHVLITSHHDWPVPEVIAGYRSQSEAESSFRQMKDTRVVSFSPMHHWTEHNIRVHVFTCVLALQIAHLMRRRARQADLDLSVRELLRELAGIGETALLYHGDRSRPGPTACSPKQARSRTSSPASSASPATPLDAEVGNTRKPAPEPGLTSENSPPQPNYRKLGLGVSRRHQRDRAEMGEARHHMLAGGDGEIGRHRTRRDQPAGGQRRTEVTVLRAGQRGHSGCGVAERGTTARGGDLLAALVDEDSEQLQIDVVGMPAAQTEDQSQQRCRVGVPHA
jgi:hypothetical protein